ncbi:MAG: serine/threonine protein kinase, partial [Deltaproteobacteria bacterium]|nr:serine/threonine protein kinase [Deltaproteobacteria bacterium]
MSNEISSATMGLGSSSLIQRLSDQQKLDSKSDLTSQQFFIDQLVQGSSTQLSQASTVMAMFGAGFVANLTRASVMSFASFSEGQILLNTMLRGASNVSAFALESASFATFERGIQNLEKHSSQNSFSKDWARSAINLGSIKFFSGAAAAQNPVLRHLMVDLGMVSGQHLGSQLGVTDRPEGDFSQQMIQAEMTYLPLHFATSLLHSISPGLMASDKSLGLYAHSQNPFFSKFISSQSSKVLRLSPAGGGSESLLGGSVFMSAKSDEFDAKVTLVKIPSPAPESGIVPVVVSPRNAPTAAPSQSTEPAVISKLPVAGDIIDGRYRIEAVLGYGGMGFVFKCTHLGLGKLVAMKVLRPEYSKVPATMERFKIEARAANDIRNPHIIEVTDFGNFGDGSSYFVMEYLNGKALSKVIDTELPVSPQRILKIFTQLAEGLSAAHKAGVIHRDLKPDNIYLIKSGNEDFVKILDFGIAKVANGSKLTMAGSIFGTPHYMSPEQAMGIALDGRSDIYSFGVMLYETISGRMPFDGGAPEEILKKHLEVEPTPLRQIPASSHISPELEAVVMKCLSKNVKLRYQSMDEVILDLTKISQGLPPDALPEMQARTVRRQRLPYYIGSGVALSALLAGVLVSLRSGSTISNQAPDSSSDLSTLPQASVSAPEKAKPPILTKTQVEVLVDPVDAHVFQNGK